MADSGLVAGGAAVYLALAVQDLKKAVQDLRAPVAPDVEGLRQAIRELRQTIERLPLGAPMTPAGARGLVAAPSVILSYPTLTDWLLISGQGASFVQGETLTVNAGASGEIVLTVPTLAQRVLVRQARLRVDPHDSNIRAGVVVDGTRLVASNIPLRHEDLELDGALVGLVQERVTFQVTNNSAASTDAYATVHGVLLDRLLWEEVVSPILSEAWGLTLLLSAFYRRTRLEQLVEA